MQITDDLVTLAGAVGSPYTRKMLAVLRYRRLPYRWITRAQVAAAGFPTPKVPLMPTLFRPGPDGGVEAVTDTSPLIRALEQRVPGREVIPADPALAWIDMLLEDYGDEWLTKAMFHYRWVYPADIERSTNMLPLWFDPNRPDDQIAQQGADFAARQIGRLGVVGSNPGTGPLIEASYKRFIGLLNAHLRTHRFLFGTRPASADFAAFGQLTQLAAFDPTPMALTLDLAPRVYAWTSIVEDLSGVEPDPADWISAVALPQTLRDLLIDIGRTYVPVMLANARAVAAGDQTVSLALEGATWTQRSFPYQAKCVAWLREAFAALGPDARKTVLTALNGTGCEALIEGA